MTLRAARSLAVCLVSTSLLVLFLVGCASKPAFDPNLAKGVKQVLVR